MNALYSFAEGCVIHMDFHMLYNNIILFYFFYSLGFTVRVKSRADRGSPVSIISHIGCEVGGGRNILAMLLDVLTNEASEWLNRYYHYKCPLEASRFKWY